MFAPLCVCQRLGHVCLLAASLLYTVNPSFLWHFRPLPPDLCFKVLFPHCCCAIYHSQVEFHVVSPPLSPVSPPRTLQRWPVKWRGVPGLGQQVSQTVPASELLSRHTWSPCTLVNPGLHQESTCMLAISSIIQKGQPLLIER